MHLALLVVLTWLGASLAAGALLAVLFRGAARHDRLHLGVDAPQ